MHLILEWQVSFWKLICIVIFYHVNQQSFGSHFHHQVYQVFPVNPPPLWKKNPEEWKKNPQIKWKREKLLSENRFYVWRKATCFEIKIACIGSTIQVLAIWLRSLWREWFFVTVLFQHLIFAKQEKSLFGCLFNRLLKPMAVDFLLATYNWAIWGGVGGGVMSVLVTHMIWYLFIFRSLLLLLLVFLFSKYSH